MLQGIDSTKLNVHGYPKIGIILQYINKLYDIYENLVTILATMALH